MTRISDKQGLRNYLWAEFPEARPGIQQEEDWAREAGQVNIENDTAEEPFVGFYDYVSTVFWWQVFEPALRSDNGELLVRCYRALEVLLDSSEELVWEAASGRIAVYLVEWPQTRLLAGPILRRELAEQTGDETWTELAI